MGDVRCRKHFGVYSGGYCLVCALDRIEELERELASDQAQELINLHYDNEKLRQRLRDVVYYLIAAHQDHIIHSDEFEEMMTAAGYVKCERCVNGVVPKGGDKGTTRYKCDCTNGWRPRDE